MRIGETVPPTIMQPLIGLGVHDEFLAGGHIAAPGTVVCWGDDEPWETDSIANPYGHGWHLDRARFDAMLLTAAVRAGAQMHQLNSFGTVEHGPDGWRVEVGERLVLRAPWGRRRQHVAGTGLLTLDRAAQEARRRNTVSAAFVRIRLYRNRLHRADRQTAATGGTGGVPGGGRVYADQ